MKAILKTGLILMVVYSASWSQAGSLYVQKWGDDGTGDGSKKNPYQTIQAAVNNSSIKGRVVVGPGLYEESVTIATEGLKVESEAGARATLIDATGGAANTVAITSNKVTFGKKNKGFTILGATGVGLIYTDGIGGAASGGKIESNISYNNGTRGFEIYCNSATIKENEANKNTTDGFWCGGAKVKFLKNFARINTGRGFSINTLTNSKVSNNSSQYNGSDGFLFNAASNSNTVKDNLSYDNGGFGFWIQASLNNKFTGNSADRNTNSGFYVSDATGLVFQKNIATSNIQSGILIFGGNPKIENNTLVNNGDDGISIGTFTNLILKGNTTVSNTDVGIFLSPGGVSVDKFEKNNIFGNDIDNNYGLDNSFPGLMPMTNFWGAASGPGVDPADATHNSGAGTITISKPSTKMHRVKTKDKLH